MDRIHEQRWFVEVNGVGSGPFLWDVLVQHARQGSFAPHHRVRSEGWTDWVPAAQVPGLFPAQTGFNNDAVTRALVPVGRAPSAIAAGYLGLLSPTGVLAPFALFMGVYALFALRKNPALHGAGRAWFGIAMGGLFTLIWAAALVF